VTREIDCAYCRGGDGLEDRLWTGEKCRVVLIHDTAFAGWCRVIWNYHARELTDLTRDERIHVMDVVAAVEAGLLDLLSPTKINIAALGTAAPHLHFHVIPRFADDPTFPDPVWLPATRASKRALPAGFADDMRRHLGML
jgi:diadenosine tetraphosphate (Ap4A) HIT family hydrolase